MTLVALASCRVLPEPDPDQPLLEDALRRRGLEAATMAWDDPAVDWSAARLTVMRSTWNYPHRPGDFLGWVDRTARVTRLVNAPAVVRANIHKSYLLDLHRRGVPVVPTRLLERGATATLREAAGEWDRVVVKPAISAASLQTLRVGPENWPEGEAHLRALAAERDVLIQPYLPSVEGEGEHALVCIDGALTHAVRKQPRFAAQHESVSEARAIGEAQRRVAEAALATVEAPLLYGRVDVAPGPDGSPVVMELELIEPSLFLLQYPPALERLAGAILRLAV
jgi:glutathione synthase/RimK-type ligase-like ATP-grasp enzyme